MSSVPDPVSRHLNVLWGEVPPHSASKCVASLVPDGMHHDQDSCPGSGPDPRDPGIVGLWHPGAELLRDENVSSSLGSTPSSIIKASGVLCASTRRLSSPPLSLILWFHWTTCKIQISFSPHGTGRLQTTSPNPLPVGLLQSLVYGIRTWIRRESPTTPKLWAIKCWYPLWPVAFRAFWIMLSSSFVWSL